MRGGAVKCGSPEWQVAEGEPSDQQQHHPGQPPLLPHQGAEAPPGDRHGGGRQDQARHSGGAVRQLQGAAEQRLEMVGRLDCWAVGRFGQVGRLEAGRFDGLTVGWLDGWTV